MKLAELLQIANSGYSDGLLSLPINGEPPRTVGDTLAEFIVLELSETFDEDEDSDSQISEAIRVLTAAQEDLDRTIQALSRW